MSEELTAKGFLAALRAATKQQLTANEASNPQDPQENGFVLSYKKNGNTTGDTTDTLTAKLTSAFGKFGIQLQSSDVKVVDLPQTEQAMDLPEQGVWVSEAKVNAVRIAALKQAVPSGALNSRAEPLDYNIGLIANQLSQRVRSTVMGDA